MVSSRCIHSDKFVCHAMPSEHFVSPVDEGWPSRRLFDRNSLDDDNSAEVLESKLLLSVDGSVGWMHAWCDDRSIARGETIWNTKGKSDQEVTGWHKRA